MRLTDLWLRMRALVAHRRAESDLDEELRFHLEMEARKLRNAGQDEREAGQTARAHFGGVDLAAEECRDARGLTPLENLGRDIRYGARMLRKSPLFTAVAVLSLAIGIGANTAVFSLVDAVLLKMLPVRNPEELVVLKWGAKKEPGVSHNFSSGGKDSHGRRIRNTFSWRIFERLREDSRTLDGVIAFAPLSRLTVATSGQALVTGGQSVSGNYFTTLGVGMALGRPFTSDDETAGGAPAAVISYRFWERVYGLDPAVLGKTVLLNTVPCVIVGVTQRGFSGVAPGGFILTPEVEISVPIRHRARFNVGSHREDPFAPDQFWVQMMGRRRPGSTDAAIEAEVAATLFASLPEQFQREVAADPPYGSVSPGGQGLADLREGYRDPLLLIAAVVGLTLLMACANLAGLLLARAAARRREIMVRLALGARRSRLVRQLLVEGALISGAGALAGLVVAYAGVRGLLALTAGGNSPLSLEVTPDARVLGFTIAISLLTTFLFALAPALRATRVDVAQGLKQDTPSGGSRFGATRVLVTAQVGVAVLLVTGAVLIERTLLNLRSVPLGFNSGNLALFDIAPGRAGYDEERAMQLYATVLERLRQTPGVAGATLSQQRLVSGWMSNGPVFFDGVRKGGMFNFVGPDFLDVMQIPMAAGRGLLPRDMAATPRVAVVNETFVRQRLDGIPPIGRRFRWGSRKEWEVEIVGVARDARYHSLRGDVPPTIYAPYTQWPFGWPQQISVEVRIAGNPATAAAAIRQTMARIDRALPLIDFKTQQAQIDDLLVGERLFAWLVGLFGAIALGLACIGLYGLVAASVAARTREIGVRIALGAGRGAVLRMVFGQVGLIAAMGLSAGLAAAWASTRVLESKLFGVKPHDTATFVTAALVVLLVSSAAALLPARRATQIEPMRALRYE